MRSVLLAVAVSCSIAGRAQAWDDFGHMEVAAAAYKKLTPATRKRVAALLRLNPSYPYWVVGARSRDRERVAFMRAATWADAIKSDPVYASKDPRDAPAASQNAGYTDKLRHRYWHYVDRPFSPDGTALVAAAAPNAATQIGMFAEVLRSSSAGDALKSYDLVWLLHLVGDVHQPLHCASRFDQADPAGDQGGNKVRVTGNALPPVCEDARCALGPPGNLHAFYDTITGEGYGARDVERAAAKLPAADPRLAAILDPAVWIEEGFELARRAVYVPPIGAGRGPFEIGPGYQNAALTLARERIALAGARLAGLLNATLREEAGSRRAAGGERSPSAGD